MLAFIVVVTVVVVVLVLVVVVLVHRFSFPLFPPSHVALHCAFRVR